LTATLCICGLAAEARIARAAGFCAIVGAGDRIRTAALVENAVGRASCLVSFGIAGALSPELRSGDVIVSTKVIGGGRSWRAPEPFAGRVTDLAGRLGAHEGAVLGVPGILATAAEKRRAWAETGALAVDIESDVVARIASAAGIPFVAVRTIADAASRELPPVALIPLADDGTPNLARVVASVLRRPRQVSALVGLARETRTALRALAGAARALHGLAALA
jgi:adenosylhomocysteine nucleosidase